MVIKELIAKLGMQVDAAGWQKADAMVSGFATKLGLMSLTVGGLYAAMGRLVDQTAAEARAAGKAAMQLGITAESLQKLEDAGEKSGLSNGDLPFYMMRLTYATQDAAQGSKELGGMFKSLGIDARSLKGQKPDEVLLRVADGFKKMDDASLKLDISKRLFGRSGPEMLSFLNKGSTEIKKMGDEAVANGEIYADSFIKQAKAYKLAKLEVSDAIKSLRIAIAGPLLRQFTEHWQRLAKWIDENRAKIRDVVLWLSDKMGAALGYLLRAMQPLAEFVGWLAQHAEVAKFAFAGLLLALAPVHLGLLTILMVIEEIWGWITGKRETLLERWLGPFSNFKDELTSSVSSNPLMLAIQGVAAIIWNAVEGVRVLRYLLGLDGSPAAVQVDKLQAHARSIWQRDNPGKPFPGAAMETRTSSQIKADDAEWEAAMSQPSAPPSAWQWKSPSFPSQTNIFHIQSTDPKAVAEELGPVLQQANAALGR